MKTAASTNWTAPRRWPGWIDPLVAAAIALLIAWNVYDLWSRNLGVPLHDQGDATSSQYIIKSIMEHGTYLVNPDVGAPFGATMYDYPIPEPTHHLLIRFIGLFTDDPFLAFNVFFLFSFASAAAAACWVFRQHGVERLPAIAGGVVFAILPYHFLRIAHVFLASYVAIPILAHYAIRLGTYQAPHLTNSPRVNLVAIILIAIAAGSGVYYAFFGLMLIGLAALIGAAQSRSWRPIWIGGIFATVIVGVVGTSMAPNVLFHMTEGENPIVAARQPIEAELLGLRITQLLMPTPWHRLPWASEFMSHYALTAPLVNENAMVPLGILGACGFLTALFAFFSGRVKDFRLPWLLGAFCAACVLYASIGGFGALLARVAIPEIRALNRISVFIAFFSLLALLVFVRHATRGRPIVNPTLAGLMVLVAWLDQVPTRFVLLPNEAAFRAQTEFFSRVQSALEPNTRVFELPYVYFPESAPPWFVYSMLEPYLHTSGLRWSFGDTHGRPSDQWYEQASRLQDPEFSNALSQAGFAAVYLDKRGYAGRSADVENQLRAQFGLPILEDATRRRAIYRVPAPSPGTVPFMTLSLGRGWHVSPAETSVYTDRWSNGDAELIVANPSDRMEPFEIHFSLSTLVPRQVTLRFQETMLSTYALEPGKPYPVVAGFMVPSGISKLRLETNTAAQPPGNGDPRRVAFLLQGLTHGNARELPDSVNRDEFECRDGEKNC